MPRNRRPTRGVGRPVMRGRDAAIFIARWWRLNCLGETVSSANDWILQHWKDHTPAGKKVGITDPAHIRSAIRKMEQTWLRGSVRFALSDCFALTPSGDVPVIVLDPSRPGWINWVPSVTLPADFSEDACVIAVCEVVPDGHRARCLMWARGMTNVMGGHAVQMSEDFTDYTIGHPMHR